jgi:hypothetical protein
LHFAKNDDGGALFGQSRRSEHAAQSATAHPFCCSSSFVDGSARGAPGQQAQQPLNAVTTQSASDAQDVYPPLGVRPGGAEEAHATISTNGPATGASGRMNRWYFERGRDWDLRRGSVLVRLQRALRRSLAYERLASLAAFR